MLIVIALGGNALLRSGEPLTAKNQLQNVKRAAAQIAKLAENNQLVITHGNGPQVGLLALQANADPAVEPYPLDVLGAETEGMIGYWLEQEIANLLPASRPVVTCLTRVEVRQNDPAFAHPTKPIGPFYTKAQAERIIQEQHWTVVPIGDKYRRVVASPQPQRILAVAPILWMLEHNAVVIAAGGGGIPVTVNQEDGLRRGVEAVIDKDLCSSLLAQEIAADGLLIATDVDAVYRDWGKSTQCPIREISTAELKSMNFPPGSMAPKVAAACQFAEVTHKPAMIGSIDQIGDILQGLAGTMIKFAGANY
jgi:carbamate kinase